MDETKKKSAIGKMTSQTKQTKRTNKKSGSHRKARQHMTSNNEKWSSEIENLNGILADKEIYINNLIRRLGGLERRVVDMDVKVSSLETQAINQEAAIADRDAYIKSLEQLVSNQEKALSDKDIYISRFERQAQDQVERLENEIESANIKIEQLKQLIPLKQKLEAEIQANQQLIGLIEQLNQHHQLLFASRTWRVGYYFAQTMRRLRFLYYRKSPQMHITSEYFQNIINGCSAYMERRQISADDKNATLHGQDSNDNPYTHADVEVTMKVLWDKIQNESESIVK